MSEDLLTNNQSTIFFFAPWLIVMEDWKRTLMRYLDPRDWDYAGLAMCNYVQGRGWSSLWSCNQSHEQTGCDQKSWDSVCPPQHHLDTRLQSHHKELEDQGSLPCQQMKQQRVRQRIQPLWSWRAVAPNITKPQSIWQTPLRKATQCLAFPKKSCLACRALILNNSRHQMNWRSRWRNFVLSLPTLHPIQTHPFYVNIYAICTRRPCAS